MILADSETMGSIGSVVFARLAAVAIVVAGRAFVGLVRAYLLAESLA